MSIEPLTRADLLRALQEQLIPQAEKAAPLVLAEPPLRAPPGVRVMARREPLLRAAPRGNSFIVTAHWVREALNAARFPYFCCVLEGEADVRVGVTRRMAAANAELDRKTGVYVVALPAHSFFLIPPNTPVSDATRPHWERPHLAQAHCRLLWCRLLPSGASLHTCTTRGATHTSSPAIFAADPQLLLLMEAALEELRNRERHHEKLARHYLLALLLRLERNLTRASSVAPVTDAHDQNRVLPPLSLSRLGVWLPDATVQRACHYIETHLQEPLTPARIAAHAYVSPQHLNRLFRAERDSSVMEYVTRRRLEKARSLLRETSLPIQRIGVMCGYPSAAHFSRLFARHAGRPPAAFRRCHAMPDKQPDAEPDETARHRN
jgi:AraC-like DNA-binding protein